MNRLIHLSMAVMLLWLAGGCTWYHNSTLRNVWGAQKPYDFADTKFHKYNFQDSNFSYRTNYDSLIKTNLIAASYERNRIMFDLMAIVDAFHNEYEIALRQGKTGWDMWSDLAVVGLGTATTLAGGEEIKTILGATTTAVKGTDLAVNKRIFHDQTVEVIAVQMHAAMKVKKMDIMNKMTNNANAYPLEEGMADITDYYYEGTMTRALQNMVNSAKDAENTATTNLNATAERKIDIK